MVITGGGPTSQVDPAIYDAATLSGLIQRQSAGSVATPKGVVYAETIFRWIFALAILGLYAFVISKCLPLAKDIKDVEILTAIFLAPLTAFLGGSVGYYFGEKKQPHTL